MLIEIHAHVIFGVDDGAQTPDDMQRMLYMAADNGIDCLFCTPHIRPGVSEFPVGQFRHHFQMAKEWCEKNAPQMRLYMGAEVHYTPQTAAMLNGGMIPKLGDTKMVLLEMSTNASVKTVRQALEELCGSGWTPILAHVERYRSIRSPRVLQKLREEYGVLAQVNSSTVLSSSGFLRKRWLKRVVEEKLVDFVSSDAHDCGKRTFCLRYAHRELAQKFGQETADALCGENFAARMCAQGGEIKK